MFKGNRFFMYKYAFKKVFKIKKYRLDLTMDICFSFLVCCTEYTIWKILQVSVAESLVKYYLLLLEGEGKATL